MKKTLLLLTILLALPIVLGATITDSTLSSSQGSNVYANGTITANSFVTNSSGLFINALLATARFDNQRNGISSITFTSVNTSQKYRFNGETETVGSMSEGLTLNIAQGSYLELGNFYAATTTSGGSSGGGGGGGSSGATLRCDEDQEIGYLDDGTQYCKQKSVTSKDQESKNPLEYDSKNSIWDRLNFLTSQENYEQPTITENSEGPGFFSRLGSWFKNTFGKETVTATGSAVRETSDPQPQEEQKSIPEQESDGIVKKTKNTLKDIIGEDLYKPILIILGILLVLFILIRTKIIKMILPFLTHS